MLTQADAEQLIAMGKSFMDPPSMIYLHPGVDISHELIGDDGYERFYLDLYRGRIKLSKVTYQTRGRHYIPLVRVDVNGSPHTNPDGKPVRGTHIHYYKEGFEDKWAAPLYPHHFTNPNSLRQTFQDFCHYCNIIDPPQFLEASP